jgi:hypothetical protein
MTPTSFIDLIEYISFRGERLTLVWKDGEAYVAVKPICERLGLAYQPQHRKLTAPESGTVITMMVTTGADGKRYEMLGLHVMDVPLWLASITPSRVKPELAEAVRAYRAECKLVLFHHIRNRLLGERDEAIGMAARIRSQWIGQKPIRAKIQQLVVEGCDFPTIRREAGRPEWKVREILGDMLRLGFIDKYPDGYAGPVQQLSLFSE